MEVAACVQDTRGHAASLLTRLNLQRRQAQFCDCVVRQKQSPAQLYPAHRCVLAASSPVLGSVLSSTGALVELQAPCLSSSVLALLLDYVYTGALPGTGTQEQYSSLLAAARYLQMDRLQEDLRDWEQSETSAADGARGSTENEREENVIGATEAQMSSSGRDVCVEEADATNAERERNDARTGSSSDSRGNDRPASHLTLQSHTLNISSTTGGYSASRVHAGTREDRVRPAGTVKPGSWQNNTDEEMEGTDEDTRSSSSPPASPASPPQPCCGAVPVICHSSRAPVLQVRVSQAPVDSSGAAGREKQHYELEDLGYRSSTDQPSAEDSQWPSQRFCYDCIKEQSDASSHAGPSVELDEEHVLSERRQADWSGDAPLPADSDVGSDSYRWDSCPKGEAREEQVLPGQCSPASHRDRYEPGAALQRAAASTKAFPPKQHGYDSRDPDPAAPHRRHGPARVRLPPPDSTLAETGGFCDRSTSLDPDKMSGAETSEPLCGFTLPEDSDASDPTCAVGQSYRGHVHYHCIPQDGRARHRPSPGPSPPRQNSAAGTSEQFLLLDISTTHAELLVSYEDRADPERQGTEGDRDGTSGAEIQNNDRRNDGASVVKARTNVDADSARRKSVAAEASGPEEDENQAGPRGLCPAPRLPAPHHAFQCSLCERAFSQRGSLNRHVRSHLGVRPFPCPRCPMTFSRQYRVTEHMRVHQRCSLESDFPRPPATSI